MEWKIFTCWDWWLDGWYIFETRQIFICEQTINKKQTFIHELWHWVYFNKLNDRQREFWEKPFTNQMESYESFASMFKDTIKWKTQNNLKQRFIKGVFQKLLLEYNLK